MRHMQTSAGRIANMAALGIALAVLVVFMVGQVSCAAEPEKAPPAAAKTPSAKPLPPQTDEAPAAAARPAKDRDVQIPANLGDPLVESLQDLKRLDPASPAWIDKKNKQVVLIGSTCRADYPLEFFATYPDRSYEAVVVIYTKPSVVHGALLALGAKPGKPVQFQPTFIAPTGTEVAIDVAWKGPDGKRHTAPAQQWIRNIKTKKPLDANWVFAGSLFWEDKSTGAKSYLADRGDFVSVTSLPTAMLDLPIESVTALDARTFEGAVDVMPAAGTPVTLILKPKLELARQ